MYNEHNTSILTLLPTCSNSLCRCNPIATSFDRRRSSKRKHDGVQHWVLMKEFPLTLHSVTHGDIVDALNRKCVEIIEEHASTLRNKWRQNNSHSVNDSQAGIYIRVLQCSYYDTCNCTARMKVQYSSSRKVISLYWYTFGYSHAMRSGSARFLTFNCHDSFQHVRLDQDC